MKKIDTKPLSGKKIAVIVESEFIPTEIKQYLEQFNDLGANVHLMSRLWNNDEMTFVSDVENAGEKPELLTVKTDFTKIDINDYAAIIMAANYPSVRLRWISDEDLNGAYVTGDSGRKAPAVNFFYRAMQNKKIVKVFPCHALWILSPIPEMLAGRRVTCNRVMLGDIRNAGAIYAQSPEGIVVDEDMITSDSVSRTEKLISAVCAQIIAIEQGSLDSQSTTINPDNASDSTIPVPVNPKKRKILMLISEWGYWGEELIGPLEEFDRVGYETVFTTPKGKRPNAITVSMWPDYIDPPLGRSVTSEVMGRKVSEIDNPSTIQGKRLDNPMNLTEIFPERPYWADPQFVRLMEIYNKKRVKAEENLSQFDALIIVGGSGPIVDLVNNQRVHDLILGFYKSGKPIAAECYGVACLAFARNIEDRKPIIWGKRVTGHCLEYDYKDGTGFMAERDKFLEFNMGPPPYPLEYILRDATGPLGAFIGNFGHPTSVIVDYPFITGRSTPDSYLTGKKLIEVLDGNPPLKKWGW
jgi:putative intracellular protease/amidase